MSTQLELFDSPRFASPIDSRRRSRKAKFDANQDLQHRRVGQALRVLEAIRQAGSRGATRNELADLLDVPLASVCGRCNELLAGDRPEVYVGAERRNGRSVLFAKQKKE